MADSANKELTAAAHALAEEEAGKEAGWLKIGTPSKSLPN